MPRRPASLLVVCVALLLALSGACAPAGPSPAPPVQPGAAPVSAIEIAIAPGAVAQIAGDEESMEVADGGDPGPVPVTRADPMRGNPTAAVTLVVFSEFQCPFCQRLTVTLSELQRRYGPDELRIVWKNNPLPFHKDARPAAEAAMALFAYHGPDAFWAFHDAILGSTERLTADLHDRALRQTGVSPRALARLLETGAAAAKVDADMALAGRLGARGTPASFINGISLSGAQPVDAFTRIIDAQLEAARDLRAKGMPAARIYAALANENFVGVEDRARPASAPAPALDDKTVHRVPIDGSPVRGKDTALVTMVMFSEFQCPFCARVAPTVEQLATLYGDKLRLVWKNNPLPFHPRAEPAAELAMEARAQKGDAAFWRACELLFASHRALEDADLEAIAAVLKLDVGAARRAIAAKKHAARIQADQELAKAVSAPGTPYFFINGRRLVGAQPIERFKALIDEEIVHAQALLAKGTPRSKVYETIMKQAAPPAPQNVRGSPP